MMNTKMYDAAEVAGRVRPHGDCPVEWGHCGLNPVYWGKPSDTPHRCSGPATHIRRALVKYHVCETCNMIGGHVLPSRYSKAGAQLRAVLQQKGAPNV